MSETEPKEPHVHFAAIDPEAEEERSARGQKHRKDLVRGIRWHQETEKTIRVVQMKDGYDFIKNLETFDALSQLSLGIKLTVQGFLAFFNEKFSDDPDTQDSQGHFAFFLQSTIPVEKIGQKLQEHLILIALHVAEDDYYGLPDAETVASLLGELGEDVETTKALLDKP